jgi:hypothetical protein
VGSRARCFFLSESVGAGLAADAGDGERARRRALSGHGDGVRRGFVSTAAGTAPMRFVRGHPGDGVRRHFSMSAAVSTPAPDMRCRAGAGAGDGVRLCVSLPVSDIHVVRGGAAAMPGSAKGE